MTSPEEPDDAHEALFIADFYPRLGAYLARRHASGYDAVAARARFVLWLGANIAPREGLDYSYQQRVEMLGDYLARIAQIPRLTAEDETELATRIAAGRRAEESLAQGSDTLTGQARAGLEGIARDGDYAGHRLLEANLWLVVSLAGQFTGRGVTFPDLVQEGNLGLIRAIQKYDATKGYRFSTFATWWIRQEMTRALAAGAFRITLPEAAPGGIDELTAKESRMLKVLGRKPTPEELAAELDVSPSATS